MKSAPSDEVIEAIKARLDAATPGPWLRDNDKPHTILTIHSEFVGSAFYNCNKNDVPFIAHAWSDIGILLTAYEGQRVEIERQREEIDYAAKLANQHAIESHEFMNKWRNAERNLEALRADNAELLVEKANLLRLLDSESQGRASSQQEREQYIRDVARIREEVRAEFAASDAEKSKQIEALTETLSTRAQLEAEMLVELFPSTP